MITHAQILTACASVAEVTRGELVGSRKSRRICRARQVGMLLAHRHTGASSKEIARFFGGRHHTTILYGIRRARRRIADGDPLTLKILHEAERKLGLRDVSEAPAPVAKETGGRGGGAGGAPAGSLIACEDARELSPEDQDAGKRPQSSEDALWVSCG